MFSGIPEQSIDFFYQLALNNQRPWFQEHKEEFLTLVDRPFKALARESARLLNARAPKYGFQPKVSRIYRDARRLFGQGPYKDHLWFSLQRGENSAAGPMLWFELGLQGTSHGLGFWGETPGQAALFRKAIDKEPARFQRLIQGIPQGDKCRLWGEEYKRPKGERGPCSTPGTTGSSTAWGMRTCLGRRSFPLSCRNCWQSPLPGFWSSMTSSQRSGICLMKSRICCKRGEHNRIHWVNYM